MFFMDFTLEFCDCEVGVMFFNCLSCFLVSSDDIGFFSSVIQMEILVLESEIDTK
jgi:hypothetical protein